MAGLWYRAGTVAVTNGSKKVVGTGTTWKSGTSKPDKGHIFWGPDVRAYEVDYVESDTVLYLVTAYAGGSATGQAYSIVISITGQVPAFSRELSAFVAYHQGQMDGWQQLLTGTGDVTLTAPDGTKLTVPSWEKIMNAGTGVVAQAKTEADRAKTEATKAAASATAAGDTVAASALPIPDVWAPLSDSLRLITGYGRDVLVGSDVVARMVNFSRASTATYIGKDGQLKTVTANEPRFEKEGLLIEGQSTNLFQNSNPHIGVTTADGYTKEVITGSGLFSDCAKLIKKTASAYTTFATVTSGGSGAYSVSVFYNYAKSTIRNISVLVRNGSASQNIINAVINLDTLKSNSPTFTVEIVDSEWIRVVGTTTLTSANQLLMFYPVATGGPSSDGAIGDFIIYQGLQLEALPFASSYIPTNGAAVTRAADICTIPNPLNIPIDAGDMTVALEVRRNPLIPASSYPRIFQIGGTTWLIGDISRFAWRGGTTEQWSFAKPAPGSTETVGYRINVAKVTVRCGGAVSTGTRTGPIAANSAVTNIGSDPSGGNNMFGHVRNLRIWRRPLTDDQMKAIA